MANQQLYTNFPLQSVIIDNYQRNRFVGITNIIYFIPLHIKVDIGLLNEDD